MKVKSSLFLNQFLQRVKFVKWRDVFSIVPMMVAFLLSLPFRIINKNIWLVCERASEARDNGYWFFKYLCEEHPEIKSVYAIKKKSVDYNKVNQLGKVIEFGSLKHWIYYFAAEKNISSQKEGKPNAALCFLLEVYLGIRKNRVYLKHGITNNNQRWIYYDVSRINLLCCASEREYDYIKLNFGYPSDSVQLVGLCRYDNLLIDHRIKKQILVLPTWREWLGRRSSDIKKYEMTKNIQDAEYFQTWNSFLCSKELDVLLHRYGYSLVFYPHPSMQQYLSLFHTGDTVNINVVNAIEHDLQKLLMESSALITDYSSISFDFAYMKKPLLYYQFDYDKFRKGHYQEGYFSYENDGFGLVIKNEDRLIDEITKIMDNGCIMTDKYKTRVDSFFAFRDTKNCKRTYDAVKNMQK